MDVILGSRGRKLLGWLLIILVLAALGYIVWTRVLRPLGQYDKYILIKNETRDTAICRIYLAENPEEGWGTNWLESPIEPSAWWATIHLPRTYWPDTFQARAEDCQGVLVEERTITLTISSVAPEGLEPGDVYFESDRVRQASAQWIIQ